MKLKRKQAYRIIDNPIPDPRAPFALLEPDGGTIVMLGASPSELATHAFARFGEGIEVRHEEDLVSYEERRHR